MEIDMATTKTLRDVMSTQPVTLPSSATVLDAARCMQEREIGDVVVMDGDQVTGIVTDRDIVIRAVAEGRDPSSCTVRDVCTGDVVTLSPDDTIERAVDLMKQKAIRRIPVVENGRPIGIVSIGDLAIEANGEKALAGISAAPANS
jgi:CBS domain-containing protein